MLLQDGSFLWRFGTFGRSSPLAYPPEHTGAGMTSFATHAADADSVLATLRDDNHTPAADRAVGSLRTLIRALRVASSASDRAVGVTAAQLFVLRQVAAEPGQSVNDLARRTLTTQSSVSEVLARLVDQGLITRRVATDDRRRAELSLTPRGSMVLQNAHDAIQEQLIEGFAKLPRDVQTDLAEGLEQWLSEAGIQNGNGSDS